MSLAQSITRQLKGEWKGDYGIAPCPGHSDHDRSMTIRDKDSGDDVLINTFGGTDWKEARAKLIAMGLLGERPRSAVAPEPIRTTTSQQVEDEIRRKIDWAVNLFTAAGPIQDTAADAYLASRYIHIRSAKLRFHPSVPITPYRPFADTMPAMVALVENEGGPCGVHITYLDGDRKVDRKMAGRVKGGAVRLIVPPGKVLAVAEGIESASSLAEYYRIPAWATLSASGIAGFDIPATVEKLMIGFDLDRKHAGYLAAQKLAQRAHAQRIRVLMCPPPSNVGDWNDLAQAEMA